MGAPEKKKAEKNSSSLQTPCCLVPTSEWFFVLDNISKNILTVEFTSPDFYVYVQCLSLMTHSEGFVLLLFPVFLHNLWGTLGLWNISPGLVCGLVSIMWTLPSQIHKVCVRCSCQVPDLFISIPLTVLGVHGLKSGLNLWMFCSSRPVLPLRQNRCNMRRFSLPIHVQGRKEALPRAGYFGRENITCSPVPAASVALPPLRRRAFGHTCRAVPWLMWQFLLSCLLPSCPDLQVHGGPVDSVLQGDPGEEPVPGHAVVPALLPDLQRLLCKQDAAEELMNLGHSLESSSCWYVNHRLVGLSTGTSWVATAWWIPKHT